MQTTKIKGTNLKASELIFGCMGLNREDRDPIRAIMTARECGINFFDHADIYAAGKCEEIFARAWEQGLKRDEAVLQSKCGIRSGFYDFSYDHIVSSAEKSLQRLGTDYLDIYLLHRPDILMEPGEIARAFDHLHESGKVRYFGVSNFTPIQVDMLQKSLRQPLIANQIRLGMHFVNAFNSYLVSGAAESSPATRGEGALEHAMLRGYEVQAYSALARGMLTSGESPEYLYEAARLLHEMARAKDTSPESLLCAFLLRHPTRIRPIIGTTDPDRIRACAQADANLLTREEWYQLFTAARGQRVP